MVPQFCSYGSAGVPAVPATIFMSGKKDLPNEKEEENDYKRYLNVSLD